jgi:dTDP-4-dehydrorhamnose reductase
MKVLVLGAGGMLGATLVPALNAQGHIVVSHARTGKGPAVADLNDAFTSRTLITTIAPEVTVNLVGLTDVDKCESAPQLAWRANVHSVENIASACRAAGCHLIHISTDQIYDGAPARLESQACPGNYYALSKYAGELAALSIGATVLRTNFFGASRHPHRRSITDWLHHALTHSQPLNVFDDVFFSPLSMATLSTMIGYSARLRPAGVFNLGSRDGLSKADFAFTFAGLLGLPEKLMTRVSIRSAELKAWRPRDMRMNSSQLERTLGVVLPRLVDEIEIAAKDYRAHI